MLPCAYINSSVKFRFLPSYAKLHTPAPFMVLWNWSNVLFEENPSELQASSLHDDWVSYRHLPYMITEWVTGLFLTLWLSELQSSSLHDDWVSYRPLPYMITERVTGLFLTWWLKTHFFLSSRELKFFSVLKKL